MKRAKSSELIFSGRSRASSLPCLMMDEQRIILHIDFNSYFATIEQQANPRLRGKPIGVTGGDRLERTVLGTASIEAKKLGVKTGMTINEAKKICPSLIVVRGDSEKYLYCTKKFLTILSHFSPDIEIFSIDEVFVQLPYGLNQKENEHSKGYMRAIELAKDLKYKIKQELGEWVTCSIGISYNKLIAKLAGGLYKPDGLVVITDQQAAQNILDQLPLDEVCGIGPKIKARLHKMGIFSFSALRDVPLELLIKEFKSYGYFLYEIARGVDHSPLIPFYQKEEVKSVGKRYTLEEDTADPEVIKRILYKLSELIARRLRRKNLVGKTVHCFFRYSFDYLANPYSHYFLGSGGQTTIQYTDDGYKLFIAAWQLWQQLWDGRKIRMIGASVSSLKPRFPKTLTLLPNEKRWERLTAAIDAVNDRFGEFTVSRALAPSEEQVRHQPNPFLADERFKFDIS